MSMLHQELCRKGTHLASGLIPLVYLLLDLPRATVLTAVGIAGFPFVLADLFRLRSASLNARFRHAFGWGMRPGEEGRPTGAFYSLIAIWGTIALFERPVACAALLMLAIGDTAASVIGQAVGGPRLIGKKTLAGTLAFLVSASLIGWSLLHPGPALAGAVAATLAELVPFPVDDNVRIPFAAGLTITVADWSL